MHELPKHLTDSLRSYRGSYSLADASDIEKGPDDQAERVELRHARSWRILKPSRSLRALSAPLVGRQQPQQQQAPPFEDAGSLDGADAGAFDHPTRRAYDLSSLAAGERPEHDVRPTSATTAKQSTFNVTPRMPAADVRDKDDPTPLSPDQFYDLMGLQTPAGATLEPRKLRVAGGLYARLWSATATAAWQYRVFDGLTYALLGAQLVLSALFIVLGSLRGIDTNTAVVALGAIATLVAGCLALMKGQGLPNRLRQTRDSMRLVVFDADELFEDFHAGRPVVFGDILAIRDAYLRVMEEARRNHPDTWNAAGSSPAAGRGRAAGRGAFA